MKTEREIEEWMDSVRIPSDEEVEAAGMRFDRRIRRLQNRRRLLRYAGIAAALMLPLSVALFWLKGGAERPLPVVMSEQAGIEAAITEPTLILSDGHSVALNAETRDTATRVEYLTLSADRVVYDSAVLSGQTENVEVRYNTLVIPAGHTYAVQLSDGSSVTLNAGSRLRYPVNFTGAVREVFLEGEAYFQVAKDEKPFEVHVAQSGIRVYGTCFNVKQQDNLLETVLVEGSIGFRSPDREEVRIVPGEQVSYDASSGDVQVCEVDTQYATAWMEGVFRYSDKPLNLILRDLSVWYGVELVAASDVSAIRLTMNLSKKTPLDEAVDFIESMTDCKLMKKKEVNTIEK